jgi:aspartate/methionine/tyrosine aminotransferase
MEQIEAGNSHYTAPAGIPGLRQAIARQVSETRGIDVDMNRVVVHPGAKPSITYTLLTYVNPGDEVIYPSPGFPVYESWVTFVEAKPVPLRIRESAGFALRPDDLAELITDRTRLIMLNTPSNPCGGVVGEEDMAAIAQVIAEKAHPDCRVFTDEVYEYIVFDGLTHSSIISQPGMEERTVLLSGHSKTYAMTGWRLGYSVLPTVEEAEIFKNLNINFISCTPPFIQEAGREALENPQSAVEIAKMVEAFDRRRKLVVEGLNAIDGVTCVMPRGAFYVFPNITGACENVGAIDAFNAMSPEEQAKSSPSTLMQMFLLYRYGVATMDRPSFCRLGSEGENYLRLSTATDDESLLEGVRRIGDAVQDADGFADFVAQGVPS